VTKRTKVEARDHKKRTGCYQNTKQIIQKHEKMKFIKITTLLFVISLLMNSCSNFGKEKEFNGVQLFYTTSITEAEANSLGDYLIKSEFADGGRKTVQLNRSGSTYEFRMVVKKGIEQDQEYTDLGKLMAAEISAEVFNGKQVDVHYCDENLETLKVLPMATY
jgi:hypothetical protein